MARSGIFDGSSPLTWLIAIAHVGSWVHTLHVPENMPDYLTELKGHLAKVRDLDTAAAVLEWDQETYMPPLAAESRAHQIATVRQAAHDLLTSDRVGALIEKLQDQPSGDEPEIALVRIAKRDYDRATKLPPTFAARLARTVALAKEGWKTARQNDDFDTFAPHLEAVIDLNREKAEALGFSQSIYDPLLDEFEPDTTTADVTALFAELRARLVPLVRSIAGSSEVDDSVLRRYYPRQLQWDFGMAVARDIGFDFDRGRQDLSAHPFTTTFSVHDVRLTTRIDEKYFSPAFFGSLHEAGHGLYEQGVDPEFERGPLASGTSLGMHESQSRLWENLVGRSRPFWSHYFPRLQTHFGLPAGITVDAFYRAVNRVKPSFIRVEADEVTYNLHIMLRFETEIDLLEGRLAVADVPEVWRTRMREYLNVAPPTDTLGCLQDIHWALGTFGYFPTYTIGNLLSVQLFDQATVEIPELTTHISAGRFTELLHWLRDRVHRFGRSRSATRIIQDACGQPLTADPWIQYVQRKFAAIYGLSGGAPDGSEFEGA